MRFFVPDAVGRSTRIAGSFVGLLIGSASLIQGQTVFAWPARTSDVSTYEHVEDCLVAARRVADSVFHHSAVWRDTTPFSPKDVDQPHPPAVVETARHCAKRFSGTTVPLDNWALFAELFLLAGRSADAEQLYARRVTEVLVPGGSSADTLRAAVTDSMMQLYWDARPIMRTQANTLLREQLQRPGWSVWRRIDLLAQSTFLEDVEVCGRGQIEFSREIEAAIQQITEADRRLPEFENFKTRRAHVLDCLSERALHDSLKRNTMGYVALRKENWAKANERQVDRWELAVGERAPRISADFWISPNSPGTTPAANGPNTNAGIGKNEIVPVPGRTSLLLFWDYNCYGEDTNPGYYHCLDIYAAVRRLAKQFPALDITIVAKTHGYFWPLPPLEPADEAKMFKKWWLDFHQIPARLATTTTEFWRLPDLDRRRIDQPNENETNYSFGKDYFEGEAFLIDSEGIIVEAGALDRTTESQWRTLINLLITRSGTTR